MGNIAGMYNQEIADTAQDGNYTPMPDGVYVVCITEEEVKPTKKGDGNYLALTMEVMDGEFKGRKLWDILNIDNPSVKARAIALKNFEQICTQIRLDPTKVADSSELKMIPFKAFVVSEVKKKDGAIVMGSDGKPELRNIIKTYAPKAEQVATTAPATPAPVAGNPWGQS